MRWWKGFLDEEAVGRRVGVLNSHRWPSSTTPFRPESQVAWLIEEGVALDHDDEAIARYARLKAEKGSYECVDDDEPVDES